MNNTEIEIWYNNLSEEGKEIIKQIVIKRLEKLPNNLKLSIG